MPSQRPFSEIDDYQRFLAQRRYQRAITRPWSVMTVAGAVLVFFWIHTAFTMPFGPTERMFVNSYFGGMVATTAVAIYALAVQSDRRWPAFVILVALAPLTLALVDALAMARLFRRTKDTVSVGAYLSIVATASYVILRRDPKPPAASS